MGKTSKLIGRLGAGLMLLGAGLFCIVNILNGTYDSNFSLATLSSSFLAPLPIMMVILCLPFAYLGYEKVPSDGSYKSNFPEIRQERPKPKQPKPSVRTSTLETLEQHSFPAGVRIHEPNGNKHKFAEDIVVFLPAGYTFQSVLGWKVQTEEESIFRDVEEDQ